MKALGALFCGFALATLASCGVVADQCSLEADCPVEMGKMATKKFRTCCTPRADTNPTPNADAKDAASMNQCRFEVAGQTIPIKYVVGDDGKMTPDENTIKALMTACK
jgi:hypothetical protein